MNKYLICFALNLPEKTWNVFAFPIIPRHRKDNDLLTLHINEHGCWYHVDTSLRDQGINIHDVGPDLPKIPISVPEGLRGFHIDR